MYVSYITYPNRDVIMPLISTIDAIQNLVSKQKESSYSMQLPAFVDETSVHIPIAITPYIFETNGANVSRSGPV